MSLFHCRSGATSIQGRRPSNQDAVLDTRLPDGRHLVAVADGMGGHRSGEVASAMALEVLVRELRSGRTLRDAVVTANAEVFHEANLDSSRAGMGTTLVALLRTEAVYEIANVGDSRAYRVDSHGIHRISVDHSFAEEAASRALMAPDEIARSPWRNALTRSLGTQDSIDVDMFGPFEIAGRPHTVMLCSDGLYRAL
jgi:protein phosphatase